MKNHRIQALLGISSCALMLASVQAWGAPIRNSATPMPVIQEPQAPPSQTAPSQANPTPNQDQSKTTTFTGVIVKDGSVSFIDLGKRYLRIDVSLKKEMDRLLWALSDIPSAA